MAFDYSKLRGRIVEKYGTLGKFAEAVELSPHSLANKMNNKRYWKQNEILATIRLLEISDNKIYEYFFEESSR